MTCDAADGWMPDALSQLEEWLAEKGIDESVTHHVERRTSTWRLQVTHREDDASRSVRAVLEEFATPNGQWETEIILAQEAGAPPWLTIDVESGAGQFVDVPRIARYYMQLLPLSDGSIRFADEPRWFDEGGVDELIDLLCDDERHGLAFVAGTSGDGEVDVETFARQVGRWGKQVYGLSQLVVLDPPATARLAREFGREHATAPWEVRTYFPGVDPASLVDARRHRFLPRATLVEWREQEVQALLGRIARRQARARQLPQAVVQLRRAFERGETQSLLRAVSASSKDHTAAAVGYAAAMAEGTSSRLLDARSGTPTAAQLSDELTMVRSILGLTVLSPESLQRIVRLALSPRTDPEALERAAAQMDSMQTRVEALEDALRASQTLRADGELERALTYDEVSALRDEVRALRAKLPPEESAHADAELAVLVDSRPRSFPELLDRLPEDFEGRLVFTGDRSVAVDLDDQDSLRLAVWNCWRVCEVLNDYVRARAAGLASSGVEHYLRHTPSGYASLPADRHAYTETKATVQQFGRLRDFPVPREVRANGKARMLAHFDVAQIGTVSPRLHYFDATAACGRIYIGYIGPHLRNTKTN